jgi:hypothetical protein
MSLEHERKGEPTLSQNRPPEQADPGQGRPADAPLVPLMRERQSGEGWSHEQLVEGFRNYLQRREQEWMADLPHARGFYLPEEIIRLDLSLNRYRVGRHEREAFFGPLLHAWDALAYDRYEPGSREELMAGWALSRTYQANREPTIKLSEPLQIHIIDALTEVVSIPRQRGQTEIEIPEKLRDYDAYQLTQEYRERVAQAQGEQERRR